MVIALASMLATAGCGAPCAAGIIANFQAESNLQPCAIGPSGVGLAQWSGARKRRLLSLGARWCDPRAQLDFVIAELREFGLLDRLFGATDPAVAARDFMLLFERPRSRDPRYREGLARSIYGRLLAEGMR